METKMECDNQLFCNNGAKCKLQEEQMNMIFQIMDNENDVTLTDENGLIIRVSNSYESHYHVTKEEVVGKNVFELEKNGIFKPSVTSLVLKEKHKQTIMQKNRYGENILTTGVPIFDGESNNIKYVISFNSIDIANVTTIIDQYNKLNELLKEYNNEINEINLSEIKNKNLVTKSKSMETICELISQIANTNANVLITGETGVGKSMIAKMMHKSSGRAEGPLIIINCGTIPENLIESELFGYEGGSFTGANAKGKPGKIELAKGGTLFLDEIGELPLNMQIKLLQVIQEKTIQRIGGLTKINVDFRLIAATNCDLQKSIKAGLFREDLYYRLNVIPIQIPPLRERKDDIIPLIDNFLSYFNKKYNKDVMISKEVFEILEMQLWPGNARQIENLIERLVIMDKNNLIAVEHLPAEIEKYSFIEEDDSCVTSEETTLCEMLEEYEKKIFLRSFEKNRTSIAVGKALGISQATAARRLRKYLGKY